MKTPASGSKAPFGRSLFHAITFFALIALFTVDALGQGSTDETTPAGHAPGAPAGSYPLSGFDSVNLYNGNLNFHLPLVSIGGRGKPAYTMTMAIDAKRWVVHQSGAEPTFWPDFYWWTGYKPGFSPGVMNVRTTQANPIDCSGYGLSEWYRNTLTRLTFTAADGTEYEFRDAYTNGAVADNYGCNNPWTGRRGRVWISGDGSSASFISDVEFFDNPYYVDGQVINPDVSPVEISGYMFLRDGTRYRIEKHHVTEIRDSNGNVTTLTYSNNGYGELTQVKDTLNRLTTITYGNPTTITFPGSGGASRQVKIFSAPLDTLFRSGLGPDIRGGDGVLSYDEVFPSLQGSGTFNPSLISRVELPDDDLEYEFLYNYWGELAKVNLPTGGSYEYDWDAGPGTVAYSNGAVHFVDTQYRHHVSIYRRTTKKRVFSDASTLAGTTVFTADHPPYTEVRPWTTTVIAKQTEGSGAFLTATRHYFHGSPTGSMVTYPFDYAEWNDGREYRTESLSTDSPATPVRRSEENWQNQSGGPVLVNWHGFTRSPAPNSPRNVETVTTLLDVSPNLVAKRTSIFPGTSTVSMDPFNNPTDTWEYDYGSGAPGALIRHTRTQYLGSGYDYVPGTSLSPNVAGTIHIRSNPISQAVYSDAGTSNKVSETTYEYDVHTGDFHAGLVGRSGISGLCDGTTKCPNGPNFTSTSHTTRGNVTKVSRWLNTTGSTLNTYSQYDVAGNVVKAIDPRSTTSNIIATNIDFADRFGGPDGDARANAGATELAGQTSFAFPTKVTNALGHEQYAQFDFHSGKPVDTEDVNGVKTSLVYSDALDRLTEVRRHSTSGSSYYSRTLYSYDDADNVITTSSDRDTANDGILQKKSYHDGLGRTWRIATYEGNTGAGNTWSIVENQFDQAGRSHKVSNPFRGSDPRNTAVPSGMWTTTTYDVLGRVVSVQTPNQATITTDYSGNMVRVTDPATKKRISRSDAGGRLSSVWEITPSDTWTVSVSFGGQSHTGYLTSYTYDPLDNLKTVTQGTQTRTFNYDSLNRLTSAVNPESGTISYQYDNASNLMSKTDARSITTSFTYDALNRVTYKDYSSYPNGSSGSWFVYDNATAGAYGKGRFHYNYNLSYGAAGELKYSYNFNDSYDALGRPLTRSQKFLTRDCPSCSYYTKDFTMSQTYDRAGNVKSLTYPSGRTVNYSFNDAGLVSAFTGRLGGLTSGGGDVSYATGVTYNPRGQRLRETFGTATSLYHRTYYNRLGQMFDTRLGTDGSTSWDVEDPNVWQWGNGTWNRGALRLFYSGSRNDYSAANPSQGDNNGNPLQMDHFVPTALSGETVTAWAMGTHNYTYDAVNRVQQVTEVATGGTGVGFDQKFVYDRWGNRTIDTAATSNVGGGVTDLSFQIHSATNRLRAPTDTGSGTDKMRYDAAGNLIWDEYTTSGTTARDFGYDADDHIGIVRDVLGIDVARYIYDPDGRRVRRIVNATEAWHVYGFGGELLAEYAFNGATTSPQKEYGYRDAQLLIVFDATESEDNQLRWMMTDHLGSTRMIVNRSGSVTGIKRRDYLPFGEELSPTLGHRTGAGGYIVDEKPRQKFGSKERDVESGLDYSQARYFSSTQGRFASPDPFSPILSLQGNAFVEWIAEPSRWNRYAYALNNPLRYVDEDGENPLEALKSGSRRLATLAAKIAQRSGGVSPNPLVMTAEALHMALDYAFPSIAVQTGALTNAHEIAGARLAAAFEGKSFLGTTKANAPGIDGLLYSGPVSHMRHVEPVQLQSNGPSNDVVGNVVRGADQHEGMVMASGTNSVHLFVTVTDPKTTTTQMLARLRADAKAGVGVVKMTTREHIPKVTILTSDGAVRVQNGKIYSCDEKGNCKDN